MKYYIGKIMESNGDYEYTDSYLFKTEGNPHDYGEKQAMEWRGSGEDDWDEDHEAWWCDSTLVSNGGHREVPKEDFDVLSKYIAVL